mgnify:FL=1|jgi:hypothetical protein
MNKKTLKDYELEAPEVPSNTCPYIDFVQEIIKEIQVTSSSSFSENKAELADSMLELVRYSNESLRRSSHYWYNKFKSNLNKK